MKRLFILFLLLLTLLLFAAPSMSKVDFAAAHPEAAPNPVTSQASLQEVRKSDMQDVIDDNDNNDLGIDQSNMDLLSGSLPVVPGASLVYYYQTFVNGPLVNTADLSANPSDDLPGIPNVTDDDSAEVSQAAPAIDLQKTVYAGQDSGASCPGGEIVTGEDGDPITYCFVVTNTGDTHLGDVTFNDADLNVTNIPLGVLSPTQSVVFFLDATINGPLLNTASVVGNPTDADGNDLDGLADVTDEDTASVGQAGMTLNKTVGVGHPQAGISCPANELGTGLDGTAIFYCFSVTNTGSTFLSNLMITDTLLGIDITDMTLDSGSLPLALGESITYYYKSVITGDVVNTAEASATPSDADGNALPNVTDVSNTDTATVDEVQSPDIALHKTVYAGNDSGATCPGVEFVNGLPGSAITYCFEVENTGDTFLDSITINDADLGNPTLTLITGTTPLAPGASLLYYYETTLDGDLVNTADVTGTPTDQNGVVISGLTDVTDSDTATVEQASSPDVTLAKTVYSGNDGGAGCPSGELAEGVLNAAITYCFEVENTGDTYLASITINDALLGITEADMTVLSGTTPLAPGASLVYYVDATITGDLVNTASVNATPSDQNGGDLGLGDVTDSDTAQVSQVASSTPTATFTHTPTKTYTPTPTSTPTLTETHTPTATKTPTRTATHTQAPSPTATNTSPAATSTPVLPTLTPTNTRTPSDTGDPYEPNDSCSDALPISTDGTLQEHTFHAAGDVDWAEFEVNSGTEYLVEAQTPSDSTADVTLAVYDECGTLPTFGQDYTFTPDVRLRFTAPEDGPLYLRLSNFDPDVGGADKSFRLSVRALAENGSPGALVLVAGRIRANDPLQGHIHHVTNEVYRAFLSHGYDSERIFYLAANTSLDADGDGEQDVDAPATNENLELALTEWAQDKVGPNRALTLYLMDHGDEDLFFLNGRNDTVTPQELDDWLAALEEAVPGVKLNIFMEACHSGSFLDSVSREGRVVMASTGTYAVAYASQQGAVFSDAFLSGLDRGMSLYGAFSEAQMVVQEAHPDQTPWMDDDGDGIPNEGADGLEAQRRGFAYVGTLPNDEKWPPYTAHAEVVPLDGERGTIRADVRDDVSVLQAWAVIYKPSYVPPNPDETDEIVREELPTVTLLDSAGTGIYSAVYEGFDEPGSYRIVVYALDGEGIQARPKAIEIQVGGQRLYLPMVVR